MKEVKHYSELTTYQLLTSFGHQEEIKSFIPEIQNSTKINKIYVANIV